MHTNLMLKCAPTATRERVDAVEGFVECASINVSLKKKSKKLNNAVNAKLDSAVRLEAGAASVMARKNK